MTSTVLLSCSGYTVTSVIRDQAQAATSTMTRLGASLEEVKSEQDERKIIDEVKPTWVIFSAGEIFEAAFRRCLR